MSNLEELFTKKYRLMERAVNLSEKDGQLNQELKRIEEQIQSLLRVETPEAP